MNMRTRKIFCNSLWSLFLLMSIVGMLVSNAFVHAEDAAEWIPDAALREAVRETLELPADVPLTKEYMRNLDIFIAEGRGISDLTGLEFAINLRELNLGYNSITDLRPLANLINLGELGLPGNRISDISPLAGLPNLVFLIISHNPISDLSQLAGLPKFRELEARRIWTTDFSSLAGLGLEIRHDEICEIAPFLPPVTERIENRTFPSIALPRRTYWDDPIYYDAAAKHDIHYFSTKFGLYWDSTPIASTEGLSTQLAGQVMEQVLSEYKKYALRNPNMLFFPAISLHVHSNLDAFPPDSEFWLKDANGQVIKNEVPWDEYTIDILNPEVQQLVIEKVVGVAECGYFSGVYFDAWVPYHAGVYEKYFNIDAEVVIEAYINILKGIRARVRDDFLILVNRNRRKSPRYAEWINGSRMETGLSYPGGYTYERLIEAEDALLWNEKHLREPRINILEADGVANQPPDGPDNLRWMRVWTTLSLTHSDGYSILRMPGEYGKYKEVPGVYQQYGDHTWYDFYDADLGKPVGEKGQLCDGCDGLFIREFTNGWAVYNRSGKPQKIQLPGQATSVASDITSTTHIVPDLDGEMYLKQEPDTIVDGTVKVLELAIDTSQESLSVWMPDTALQAVVREALEELGVPASAPLTKEKMLQLTTLKANHRGIVDITGLEFATYLKELYLGGRNRITDLRPLANLTNLTQLHIWHREVAGMSPVTNLDISPLSGLVNLERLSLENNGISDISLLAGLKKLQLLGLSHNVIEDLSPLAGLKELWHLNLSDNNIKGFSPIAGLTNLRELWIENNPATDFSPLAALNLTDFRSDVDVNDDGEINILDLVAVANALGEAEPDLNGDGVVNIQDLVIVANAF
ncbi:MAG: leucine-rich repeat domain-containing protein [Candidatus Poribacteria bacterium]|nr:leucine-rich repeat domain-containing protein [Candidatus Poribacteria bacterium]